MTADSVAAPFWDAACRGVLRIQRCTTCGRSQFYPRSLCRYCHGHDLEWIEASGHGRIYSYTTVYRAPRPELADQVPYTLVLVELDERVRMLATLAPDQEASLEIDAEVEVWFDGNGTDCPLPRFRISAPRPKDAT